MERKNTADSRQESIQYMASRFSNVPQKFPDITFVSLSVSEQIEKMNREIAEAEQKLEREFLITSLL